jgi:regulator of nucleoside diphosphate kinase
MKQQIWINVKDRDRLQQYLEVLQEFPDKRELPHIKQLEQEIGKAKLIIDPLATPRDVITMRSRVRLKDLNTQSTFEYTLVYPAERDPDQGHISVLAPLGTAMLGYRVGDTFEVELPRGRTRFQVEELLYQPEAAGDTNL